MEQVYLTTNNKQQHLPGTRVSAMRYERLHNIHCAGVSLTSARVCVSACVTLDMQSLNTHTHTDTHTTHISPLERRPGVSKVVGSRPLGGPNFSSNLNH